jgi:hypothetical protein
MSEERYEEADLTGGQTDAQAPETAGEPQPEQPDNGWGADGSDPEAVGVRAQPDGE